MIERKDISGFMLMRDADGVIHLQVIADGTDNMSVVTIDAFNVNIADMLDSLMEPLAVADSLVDTSVTVINAADKEEATSDIADASADGKAE
jgi:phosphoribosylaminoimidazole (AIR) synthetase